MFIIYFILPVLTVYASEFICAAASMHSCRQGLTTLRKPQLLIVSLPSVIFNIFMLTVVFMDFKAILGFGLLKFIISFVSAAFFALMRRVLFFLRRTGSYITAILAALAVALFLEAFIFNFRFYQTYTYEPENVTDRIIPSYSLVLTEGSDNEYTINNSSTAYFEITGLDNKIHDIYLDITALSSNGSVVSFYATTYMTDESNEIYYQLPAHTVNAEVESTKYLYLNTNGNSAKLKINISSTYGKTFIINKVLFNAPRQFDFSILRPLMLMLLIFLAWLLRPSSDIYSHMFCKSSHRQRLCTCAVIMLEIALLLCLTILNPAFIGNPSRHTAQYQQLAESFLNGRLYLAEEPAEFLAEMDNPYDYNLRTKTAAQAGQTYYWDAAYYGGHYYVYFGVLPVLLLYLPFRAITGQNLPNRVAIQIFLCLFAVAAFMFIAKLISRFFREKRIPYASYLILSLIFVNATGAVFIAKRPDFYSIPIISALFFTILGLYLWLCATDTPGKVKVVPAVFGSLCMALVAGCRPQLLLVSLLIFPIFFNSVFRDRTLFSKKGILKTVAICLPYIAVAAGIMWYNAARFSSPFDFGANYNLTTNDMTGRGFNVERCGLAFFTYFLQPPVLGATFPFIFSTAIRTNYLGVTVTEPMFGGIFATIPLLWLVFLLPYVRKYLKDKSVMWLAGLSVFIGIFIGLFDAQGAGLLQRYVSDFAFLPCIAAVIVAFALFDHSRGSRLKQLSSFLCFAFFASLFYCFFIVFANYNIELCYKNPSLYSKVSSLIQFWC